jgi:ferric-dicitrate binding protein FerR (iron transport regulator)
MTNHIYHKQLIRIIRKYLAGQATEKEKDFLESYYDYFEKEPDVLDNLTLQEKTALKNQMRQFILNRIEKPALPVIPLWKKVSRIAALAVVFLSVAFLSRTYLFSPAKVETEKEVTREITAEAGKQVSLYLSDGSIVLLKGGSTLRYKNIFKDSVREVHLTGEAYFEVARNETKPFIVYSGKVRTRVLGTAFTVKAYPGEKEILVRVVRGKVRVDAPDEEGSAINNNRESVILIPDQELAYNISTGHFTHNEIKTVQVNPQKSAEYTMDNLTIAQAAKVIAERFGKEVRFEDPAIQNSRITVSFFEKDPLEEVLTVICGVSKATYTIVGDTIVIAGNGYPKEKGNN